MVEPVVDEQQQAEQNGDRAQQAEMRTHAPQAHETAEPQKHDTAEKQPGPQQAGYSRFGVQDSLIPLRRQRGQLVEKLLTYRTRRNTGLLITEHPVHLVERVSRTFGSTTGAYRVFPFRALDRLGVVAEQSAHLGLLGAGHTDG